MSTAAIRAHWNRVAALGCLVSGSDWQITIHHCHGGSLCDRGFNRAFGRKTSDWLVIPLTRLLHVGPGGIDGFPRPPVEEWEAKYRTQAEMLDEVCHRLGVDVWAKALQELKPTPRRAA